MSSLGRSRIPRTTERAGEGSGAGEASAAPAPRPAPDPERKAWRARCLATREALDAGARAREDEAIAQRLADCELLAEARTIGVYFPIRAEPDLRPLCARWRAQGRRVALPVTGGPGGGLLFFLWEADAVLLPGPYGIPIPRDKQAVAPDALLLPCVGFHVGATGLYRLGYGGGFYDRTLAARRVTALGVAYDALELSDFRPKDFDEPLAAVVTGSRFISSIASP